MTHSVMLILGIFVLCAFYPFSAISFRMHRLPKKKEGYLIIHRLLSDKSDSVTKEEEKDIDHIFESDYRGTDYILPVFFVTLFSILGFYVLFNGDSPIILNGIFSDETAGKLSYPQLSLVSIGMAILGSYVWSIQYIVRRLIALDLAPGAYYSVGTRIIFATFVSLVLHHFIEFLPFDNRKMLIDQLPAIAFFTGIFPQRAMQYMQEQLRIFNKVTTKAHPLPLDVVEGISMFTKVRFAEVGIDNAQNLAQANFKELVLKTPFNPRLILDWIAQAKLYIIVKDSITDFRKAGIRTIFDLVAAFQSEHENELEKLSKKTETDLSMICADLIERPDITLLIDIRKKLSTV